MGWRAAMAVCACAAGCGRIGFDAGRVGPTGDGGSEDGATVDAPVFTGSGFVLSATVLTASTTFSWVDLDVDWTRSMAYLSSREPGTCFAAVDFSATPTVVARRGSPQTAGETCLGVSLDSAGRQLLVGSSAASVVELWDLGADPRAGNYTRLGSLAVSGVRRITRDFVDPSRFYAARGASAPGLQSGQVLSGPSGLQPLGAYASNIACPNNGNDAASLASGVVIMGCANNFSPVEVVDATTMTVAGTIPATPPTAESGFWSAAHTADGQLGVMSGWVSVIASATGASGYTLVTRFDNADAYRGITIADRGDGPELWAARGDGQVEVVSLATPADPVVVARTSLGVAGEAYAIRVSPALDRAIVVTNRGFFILGQLSGMPPISERPPTF